MAAFPLYSSAALVIALSLVLLNCPATTADGTSGAGSSGGYFPPFYKKSVGINYGRVADNLPPPDKAVQLIQSINAAYVRIYDADAAVLTALAGTAIQVTVTIPNEQIQHMASDPSAAATWIHQNVLPFYPKTLITTVVAGNELLSPATDPATRAAIIPAMQNVHAALADAELADSITITTSLAMDVLAVSYPPESGAFADAVAAEVAELLAFLRQTGSFLMLDVYPFLAWADDPDNISLSYALMDSNSNVQIDGNAYTSMLDAQIDSVYAAAERAGYADVAVVVGETGWPTAGHAGATVDNAATYNRRLVERAVAQQPIGTPRRRGVFVPVFIFALFNEDLKPGADTERNWGLFYPDGTAVYQIDLSSSASSAPVSYSSAMPTQRLSGPAVAAAQWCVVNAGAEGPENAARLQAALDFACGNGADCGTISVAGQPCFEPDTLPSHAAYAFNSYWQRAKSSGATCDFFGAAALTDTDPSYGDCAYEHS